MSENAEATEGKVAKKRAAAAKKAAKKAPAKTARKAAAKKAPAERDMIREHLYDAPAKKRGRPAGKRAVDVFITKKPSDKPSDKPARKAAARKAGVRRGKKGAKQFAYLLLTSQEDGSQKASAMNGPFTTESNALDDASIMADDNTTIVLFRETKRGRVQKQTKFVAGR